MWHPRRDIERLLAGTLPSERADAVHLHLSLCADCRRRWDEAVVLERVLAGDSGHPSRREEERLLARVLEAIPGERRPGAPSSTVPHWRVRSLTFGVAAAAVAAAWLLLSPAATLVEGVGVRIGGDLAQEGAAIRFWNRVEVDAGGYGLLKLDGAVVTVGDGASLRVGLGGRSVELTHAKVWCEVERGRGQFTVRTDEALARVLGTSFAVDRPAPGATSVRVRQGSVEVRGRRGGAPVIVGGGTKTTVTAGEPPAPPTAYSGAEDADILILLRRLGRALGRGIGGALEWLRQGAPP